MPDYIVTGPDFAAKGYGGLLAAGFLDHRWRVAPAVSGGDVRAVLSALHAQAPSAADPRTSGGLRP